jgi:hypothetical protein
VDNADPLDEVAVKVRSALTVTDERLTAALDEIRERWAKIARVECHPDVVPAGVGERAQPEDWRPDVPCLLAAIDRALELTDPFTNPTKGGTFLAAVGVQVREAMLAELTRESA